MAKKPEMAEIASTANGRDITRGFIDSLPLIEPTDSVLRKRGNLDYRIYDEVLRDDQVASTFGQRRLAVVSREWEVLPGGESAQDQAAADHLREVLEHIGWDARTDKMLYGVYYGHAVAECLWARDGRHITMTALKVRNRRRFGFAPDGGLRLKTSRTPHGEVLPERKFWSFETGSTDDDEPYGLGLAHWLYWPVLFKRNGLKFWLIFLEKFGMPTVTGKYPPGATEQERRRLLEATQAVQTDSGVILPEGMMLELLEAARAGRPEYEGLYDHMDRAITKVVLGHTGGSDSTPGKLGSEDMAQDVRRELIKADADLVCDSFNRGPARWLTDWNYPGAAYPKVWRKVEDSEDLGQVAERERKIIDMGFRPTLRHIQDTYGGEWVEAPRPAAGPPGFPAFAEGEVSAVTDALADRLEQDAADPLRAWLDQIREFAETAPSLEALRDRLLHAYGDLPTGQLAEVMALGFAAADVAGRRDVAEESGMLDSTQLTDS